ncbi:hypothetical protein fHeYen901_145 [Yersinia phage fHe-Yen9-01]|uniref:Uncharacterized protein n=1 Tax=Yersinia phage fHe-Yen9-01 TaxID=1965363 RepID=A0A1V0DXQ0_9CAUD|nr:hypothetical protein KNT60_gp144 [Yersinia phage fHe-Yen9-01]ARB05918.1 hypothetical protein fHeYen901_145 [Yersinia phage fHe-Yen9-01]
MSYTPEQLAAKAAIKILLDEAENLIYTKAVKIANEVGIPFSFEFDDSTSTYYPEGYKHSAYEVADWMSDDNCEDGVVHTAGWVSSSDLC